LSFLIISGSYYFSLGVFNSFLLCANIQRRQPPAATILLQFNNILIVIDYDKTFSMIFIGIITVTTDVGVTGFPFMETI
jgi:hypothetical protein